jgi:hypothetical protein
VANWIFEPGPSMSEPRDGDAEMSGPETDRGRAIFEELLWVHSTIRRDLEIVEQLAATSMPTTAPRTSCFFPRSAQSIPRSVR